MTNVAVAPNPHSTRVAGNRQRLADKSDSPRGLVASMWKTSRRVFGARGIRRQQLGVPRLEVIGTLTM